MLLGKLSTQAYKIVGEWVLVYIGGTLPSQKRVGGVGEREKLSPLTSQMRLIVACKDGESCIRDSLLVLLEIFSEIAFAGSIEWLLSFGDW